MGLVTVCSRFVLPVQLCLKLRVAFLSDNTISGYPSPSISISASFCAFNCCCHPSGQKYPYKAMPIDKGSVPHVYPILPPKEFDKLVPLFSPNPVLMPTY